MNAPAKILLVDDRPENLTALVAVLRQEDRELLQATSGRAALELLLTEDVALALIDIEMPGMDGVELAELMRGTERTRAIPIIFVTAALHDQTRLFNGYEAGAVDFLFKPIDPRMLRSKVDVFLELHRQRRQLVQRITELEAVLAAVPAAVFIARDAEARRIETNPAGAALLRRRTDDTAPIGPVGGGFRVLQEGREVQDDERPLRIAASRGEEVRGWEFTLVFDDDTRVHMFGNATPLRTPDGRVTGAVGAFVDVTERKRAEERLLEADRRKDEFLAVLSHELRNPLMPIRTSLYLLDRLPADSPQGRQALAVIDRQTHHLARLIDDLLDVQRITSGKMSLRREPVELEVVVGRAAQDHRAAFDAANIALRIEVGSEPLPVTGDATRLAQIVGNLLGNAAKFTPAGGTVTLALARDHGGAVLHVRDTGVGIARDVLSRLFEPFAQADRTLDRSRGGLGLGLALVRSLTEMHGGTVAAYSAGPGHGAEFVVRLPLRPDDAPAASPAPARTVPAARRRVLVVEDNADGAEALGALVGLMGHAVEVAHDGLDAIARAHTFRPDTVLCDIGLPGIDGYEVARRLSSDPALRGVQLVALTGYAQPEDRARTRAAGFTAHLSKPPDLDALERLLAAPRAADA
ncbi:MAG: response regulator [bacterium]|nr:response regulator [bacterium]